MDYKFLKIQDSKRLREITLNRPEVHNAFNDEFISEMINIFSETAKNENIQVVVLNAEGKSFCAGADLNWMKSMINYSLEENKADSFKLVHLFDAINELPQFLLGIVQGHVFGGGLGIIASCDYVISSKNPLFCFSEVRLGLLPAVISKYVYPKMGYSHARAYMSSGLRFDAFKAKEMGLIHEISDDLVLSKNKIITSLLKAAPEAMKATKKFVKSIDEKLFEDKKKEIKYDDWSVEKISQFRIKKEGQEGMNALLNKEKPSWDRS